VLIQSKMKLLFFPRVYNVNMFCAYQIYVSCCSQAMLHQGDCSAIKLKVRAMNINIGLKSLAAKATTDAMVPTPLLDA